MGNLSNAALRGEIVSFPDEDLILVDGDDQEVGHLDKAGCHRGEGILHRAFSLFVFNDAGELLLQQRSADKPLWPLYWSNSCCSHPRRGETVDYAVNRRLEQELGMRTDAEFVYKFQYHAQFDDTGAERELCWVYLGHCNDLPQPNKTEVADWRFISAEDLNRELTEQPDNFTPWFKMEWTRLNTEHKQWLQAYLQPSNQA